MNFVITSESTTDLSKNYVTENQVEIIPMTFYMDGKSYFDDFGQSMAQKEFYGRVRGGMMPTTSQIPPETFKEFFMPFLQDGKDVLHIAFSAALSGSCNSAQMAAQELNEVYDNKVIVISSLCASMGEGLLVHYATQYRKEGHSLEETAEYLRGLVPHLCHYFTVDDLGHLHRGGRVSKTTAIIGSVLGIKPVLHVDDEGRLINIDKVRGRRQSLIKMVDYMEQTVDKSLGSKVFISHGDCIADAEFVRQEIKNRLGMEDVDIHFIGPVIGAHSGPGTIAIFFLGTHR